VGCLIGRHISSSGGGSARKLDLKKSGVIILPLCEISEKDKLKCIPIEGRLRKSSSGDGCVYILEDCKSHTKETKKATVGHDADGNKVVNEYVMLKVLGCGSYGKVKLCISSTNNEFYAVKIYQKEVLKRRRIGLSSALQDVIREIAIMKKLDHENIVKLYEVIDDDEHERIYMVMEYVDGGSLADHEGEPYPMDEARKYFRDIISGLEYLHSQKVIHRDIKPENLLVTLNGVVKISDFGVSHLFQNDDDTLTRSAGSPAFLAPELCTVDAAASGKAVDIWACGITLYCIAFGHVPFMADNLADIYECIRNDSVEFPETADPLLRDLLEKMLDKNPKTRIKMPEIKAHPWVTCNGTMPLDNTPPASPTVKEVQHVMSNKMMKLKARMKAQLAERAPACLDLTSEVDDTEDSDEEVTSNPSSALPEDSDSTSSPSSRWYSSAPSSHTVYTNIENTDDDCSEDLEDDEAISREFVTHEKRSKVRTKKVRTHSSKSTSSGSKKRRHRKGSKKGHVKRPSEDISNDEMPIAKEIREEADSSASSNKSSSSSSVKGSNNNNNNNIIASNGKNSGNGIDSSVNRQENDGAFDSLEELEDPFTPDDLLPLRVVEA